MVDVKWEGKPVKIRYWCQTTTESGYFAMIGPMNKKEADRILKLRCLERAEIVDAADV